MKKELLSGLILLGMVSTPCAEHDPKRPWKNKTEAAAVSTNGNTKSSTYEAKNTYTHDWKKLSLELIGGALGASSRGETTAEQYMASEKFSYKLSDRNYVFEKIGWSKDRFAGIQSRVDSTLGLGRELFKTAKDLWIAELSSGYIFEDRTAGLNNDFASGRGYSKYEHVFTPTASVTQDAEYLQNFEDPDDFRVNTESALVSALSSHLSLKVSYKWKHVGVPPLGFSRNDTITSVALIANY